MLEGTCVAQACVTVTTLLSYSQEVYRSGQQQFLNANFAWTSTKCRKTRAMLRDFTIVDSLALRQLRHFDGSRCSLAKIAIPCTIYLSLNLPEFYV